MIPRIPGAALQVLPSTGQLYRLNSPTELVRNIDQFVREFS